MFSNLRIGHGYDVHRLVEGRRCIIGGVDIPYERGLLGHSDADVLAHALADAIMCASGHTPQMRGVMRGISSTGRPSQNFSKPLSSGTWK